MQSNSTLQNMLNHDQFLSPIDKLVYFLSFLAALFDPRSRLTHISETLIEDTLQKLLPDLISLLEANDDNSIFPDNQELSLILYIIKNTNQKNLNQNSFLTYLTKSIINEFQSKSTKPLSETQIANKIRLLTANLILQHYQDLPVETQSEILNQYFSVNSYDTYIQAKIITAWNQHCQPSGSFNISADADFFFDAFFQETTNLGLSILGQTANFEQVNKNPIDPFIDFISS